MYKLKSVEVCLQNKHHQATHRVIPGSDPGSSLLETATQPRNNHPQAIKPCHHGLRPVIQCPGVAKSVCHRDRRSLQNRQLRCLCRTDFGSPIPRSSAPFIRVNLREPLDPGSSLLETTNQLQNKSHQTIYPDNTAL